MADEGASGSWRELRKLLGAAGSFEELQRNSGSFRRI